MEVAENRLREAIVGIREESSRVLGQQKRLVSEVVSEDRIDGADRCQEIEVTFLDNSPEWGVLPSEGEGIAFEPLTEHLRLAMHADDRAKFYQPEKHLLVVHRPSIMAG